MSKRLVMILFSFALVFFLVSQVNAANFLGEYCWQLQPFPDVLKLSVSQGGKQYELHGSLALPGGYQLTFTGSAYVSMDTQSIVMGGVMSHDGPAFGGATGLSWHGTLDPASLSGPFTVNGLDMVFTNSGTLILMACPPGPVKAEAAGQGLGE